MKRQLLLNVSPIHFGNSDLEVGVFAYRDSHEQLRSLRGVHAQTHVFRRLGNRILSVPFVRDAPPVGEYFETVNLHDNLSLCASLISNSFINYFHRIGRKVLGYLPIKFIADGPDGDLLAQVVPPAVAALDWLSIKPLFELDVRVLRPDRQAPFVGVALDVRTTRQLSRSCAELMADGFDPTGLYVGRRVEHTDPRIFPRLELLGRVAAVAGQTLRLTDARPESNEVDANAVQFELRNDAFNRLLSHGFKSHAPYISESLDKRLGRFRSGPERLDRLRKAVAHLGNTRLEMAPGITFRLTPFLSEREKRFPAVRTAPGAVYVFDPAGASTNTWHDGGLDRYGPYSARTHTPSHPRICVICQKTKKGQVEQFLNKLLNGIRHVGSGRAPFEKGLIRKYGLEDASPEFFVTDDDTAPCYRKAVRQALEYHGEQGPKWNLALVQIDEHFHELYGKDNPYLVTKAGFLRHQITVQEFEIETVNLPNKRLSYALNNMALATYAKLGGIPWLIRAEPGLAHELVIGLGSARIGEGRLGESEQVVGITTVFTGDGNYCISSVSKVVPISDYKDTLLDTLRKTVGEIRNQMNWQKREPIRLIFHAFKPLKDAETEAVKTLMSELGEYDVDYAFIHIIEDHPYLLIDEFQEGIKDYETGGMKGVLAPTRGVFFRLSAHEVLLSLTGAKEVKRPQDGLPHPILLSLHRGSTFEDTTYLARQVYTFSCHSWRSFFPATVPVTILYSELIARLLGQLSTLPTWDPDVMLNKIGRTRWFL
jgi:hypothetical protein